MECGPNGCPIAGWRKLSPAEKRAQRKKRVQSLHKQNFAPEAIAADLGVSLKTVYNDLEFCKITKLKQPKTASNPKGAGRPRGSRSAPKLDKVQAAVDDLVREGQKVPRKKLADEFGVSPHTVQLADVKARGKLEAEPIIAADMLSMTAQEKLDTAIRQHQRKLEADFQKKVVTEVERRMNETVLPAWKETIEYAEAVRRRDKGVLTAAEYKLVRSCLHPDRIQDEALKRKFAEAFGIITALEKFLCKPEKEPPAKFPRTWQEAQSSACEKECAR